MERTEFKPELMLNRHQQAALAQTCSTEGYKIIHMIVRSEVDKFVLDLLNAPSGATDDEKLEKLRVTKTAAMLYEGVTNRINHEVGQYALSTPVDTKPIDITEGLLDLGAYASRESLEATSFEEGADNEFN